MERLNPVPGDMALAGNRPPEPPATREPVVRYFLREAGLAALIAGAYFLAGRLGFYAAAAHDVVSSLWPPSGLALFILLRYGWHRWPGIAVGAVLLNATSGVPWAGVAGVAVGNTLEALTATMVLNRVHFRTRLHRVRDVLYLSGVAALFTWISAVIGTASLLLSQAAPPEALVPILLAWWSGDAVGILVLTPLLLAWSESADARRRRVWYGVETVVSFGVLAIVTDYVLSRTTAFYPIFPFVFFIAMRRGIRGAATAITLVALIGTWKTLMDVGPFSLSSPVLDLYGLQALLFLLSLSTLLFAAALAERTDSEELARQNARQLTAAQQLARMGSWHWDIARNVVAWSPELYAIYGLRVDGAPRGVEDFLDRLHPDDRGWVKETIERSIANRHGFRLHERIVRPDGSIRVLATAGEIISDGAGIPKGLMGICQDVTEQWNAERVLREREAMLGAVFERSAIGISMTDLSGRYVRANAAFLGMLGYTLDELRELSRETIVRSDESASWRDALSRLVDGQCERCQIESRLRRKDGAFIWTRNTLSLIADAEGRAQFVIAIVEEITERKRAETELLQAQHAYREIVERAPIGIFRSSVDGQILLANRTLADMLGYRTPDALRTLDLRRDVYLRSEDRDALVARYERMQQPYSVELEWRRADGTPLWVQLNVRAVSDERGRLLHFENFVQDVTNRKRADERLEEINRVNGLLASTLDVDRLLEIVVTQGVQLAGAESGYAGLIGAGGDMTSRRYYLNGRWRAFEQSWKPNQGLPGWLARQKSSYLTNQAETDPQIDRALARRFGITNALATPILGAGGEPLGFFELHNKPGPIGFTGEDQELAQALAHAAGLAIQNALSYREQQRSVQRYRTLARHLPNATVAVLDQDLRILLAEDPFLGTDGLQTDRPAGAAQDEAGDGKAEVRRGGATEGRTLWDVLPEAQASDMAGHVHRVFENTPVEFELEYGDRAHLVRLLPLTDERGRVTACMALSVDITERRRQEQLRRLLLARLINAQEDERRRISRELHDEAGQSLTALRMGLDVLRASSSLDDVRSHAKRLAGIAADALQNLGRLARGLHPSVLDDLGLPAALDRYTRDYTASYAIPVDLQVEGFEGQRCPPQVETTLYRIVLEALTNVARHSKASRASILLRRYNGSIEALVDDDGRGFDVAAVLNDPSAPRAFGLHGIRERAELLAGTATIESAPGRGTTVAVRIPVSD